VSGSRPVVTYYTLEGGQQKGGIKSRDKDSLVGNAYTHYFDCGNNFTFKYVSSLANYIPHILYLNYTLIKLFKNIF
jgi:hypothetical protein